MIYNSITNFHTAKIQAIAEVKGFNKWIYIYIYIYIYIKWTRSSSITVNFPQIDL